MHSQAEINRQVERASAVQARYADELMRKPNVVGVGVGFTTKGGQSTGEVGLIVLVERKLPEAQLAPEAVIPAELEGVRVDVQETGGFSAQ